MTDLLQSRSSVFLIGRVICVVTSWVIRQLITNCAGDLRSWKRKNARKIYHSLIVIQQPREGGRGREAGRREYSDCTRMTECLNMINQSSYESDDQNHAVYYARACVRNSVRVRRMTRQPTTDPWAATGRG